MAAGNMQDIKRRMKSVRSTEHITNAMKLVSSAKFRKAKTAYEKTSKNFHFIIESIESVFNNASDIPSHYLDGNREVKKTGYIIITSNRGLCGSFNTNVIKEAEIEMSGDLDAPILIAIGSKGRDYFAKRGYEIYSEHLASSEDISFFEARSICEPLIHMYNKGEIDRIELIYTSYINTLEQSVKNVKLLPFQVRQEVEFSRHEKMVEYEPSVEAVFNYLVPKYVELQIFSAIIESATCEHAARRMAMESATDNARDMLEKLSLFYNRARQAAITDEIIEIVAGSEAQK